MKPHIQATLADLEAQILDLVELRNRLVVYSGGDEKANMVETPLSAPKPTTKAKPMTAKSKRKENTPTAAGARAISVGLTIKEPFCPADLQAKLGTNYKNASNFITRWKKKGWIVQAAYGEYQRTKAFGGVTGQSNNILKSIHEDIAATTPAD